MNRSIAVVGLLAVLSFASACNSGNAPVQTNANTQNLNSNTAPANTGVVQNNNGNENTSGVRPINANNGNQNGGKPANANK